MNKYDTRIDLIDGYWIGADRLNYILCQTYIGKESIKGGKKIGGKLTTTEISYHRTINEALEKFMKLHAKDHTADFKGDIAEYAKFIAEKQNEAVKRLSVVWNASEAKKELE
jgi:uncharacterized protein YbjQ (UPF0145 family)